jgi:hypothetical protein
MNVLIALMKGARAAIPSRQEAAIGIGKSRKILLTLVLCVTSSLGTIVGAEIVLRIWTPNAVLLKHIRRSDPILNHSMVPNASVRFQDPEYEYVMSTNRQGYRDGDFDSLAQSGFRIAMLGDSFTEGVGVPIESTFVKRTERLFWAERGKKLSCMNFGVAGYSPILEYIQLTTIVLKYKPSLVILNYNMNDVMEDSMYASLASLDSHGLPVSVQPVIPVGWGSQPGYLREAKAFLQSKSYVVALVRYMLESQFGYLSSGAVLFRESLVRHTVDSNRTRWEPLFAHSESYIGLIADTLKALGVPLLLNVHPIGNQVGECEWVEGRKMYGLSAGVTQSMIFRSLEEFCTKHGIAYLDSTPALRRQSDGTLYFQRDGHWTVRGHRVVADTLVAYLNAHEELLPGK